jgi:hypothetical protein
MNHHSTWNFLPGRLPQIGVPVLTVKGVGRKSFVREAVYAGRGYWRGFGDAPVRAWRPLPHTPITLALEKVFIERDAILDIYERNRTSRQRKRLLELDTKIELAQQARESEYESFVRRAALALQTLGGQKIG